VAQRRLVVLDFDGTLVPITDDPRDTKPSGALLSLLAGLTGDPDNEVVLISGRDRLSLHNWFAWLPMGLAAEHGVWLKKRAQDWRLARQRSTDWKLKLKPLLDVYADRLPGALVEEKEYSLVWHYRRADVEQGALVARALTDDLLNFTGNIDVQVVQGSKSVEVRSSGVGKAAALGDWLRDQEFDFVLAVGDDHDDEELFAALPAQSFSIRVGIVRTAAQFNLREPKDVIKLLETLRWAENPPRLAAHHGCE
jgi:trehalose 6-phosphate synthase/phosphatase